MRATRRIRWQARAERPSRRDAASSRPCSQRPSPQAAPSGFGSSAELSAPRACLSPRARRTRAATTAVESAAAALRARAPCIQAAELRRAGRCDRARVRKCSRGSGGPTAACNGSGHSRRPRIRKDRDSSPRRAGIALETRPRHAARAMLTSRSRAARAAPRERRGGTPAIHRETGRHDARARSRPAAAVRRRR